MIKKIIFDLDDTLIPFDNKLLSIIDFSKYSLGDEDINKIVQVLFSYEKKHDRYRYNYMLSDINEVIENKLSMNDFLYLLKQAGNLVPKEKDKKLIETLEYLSSKYELVVLTNFFTIVQKERLRNYGILKYFKKVVGTDITLNKPYKESYLYACGNTSLDECLMIGDDLFLDVLKPIEYGIDAIWYNPNKNNTKYKSITTIEELKNIL